MDNLYITYLPRGALQKLKSQQLRAALPVKILKDDR
jgi:hypothetical protein